MSTLTESENAWLNGLTDRLRLVQADTATSAPEQRRELLNEELSRCLGDLPAQNRKRCLEALLKRLPIAGRVVEPSVMQAAPAAAPSPPKPQTPSQLLERLVESLAQAPAEERAAIGKRLADVGLIRSEPAGASAALPQDLTERLGLPAGAPIPVGDLAKLCAQLVELMQRFDERALATLSELSKKSALLRRRPEFKVSAGQSLGGETGAADAHLREIARLIGAFLASSLGASKEFAKFYAERLSSAAIEDLVTSEGSAKLFGPSKSELCWQKYRELSERYLKAELIERNLKDCIVKFMERVAQGDK